jgi:hypothetical protein
MSSMSCPGSVPSSPRAWAVTLSGSGLGRGRGTFALNKFCNVFNAKDLISLRAFRCVSLLSKARLRIASGLLEYVTAALAPVVAALAVVPVSAAL